MRDEVQFIGFFSSAEKEIVDICFHFETQILTNFTQQLTLDVF